MEQIQAIIQELKVRNYAHFETFYLLTKQQVFFSIVGIIKDQTLAEDLLQDTYMRFLEKIDQFKEGGNPYAYLTAIARNLAFDLYNERKKVVRSEDIFETIPSPPVEEDASDDIMKLLDLLDLAEREVVTMHVINDLKFREIASIMKKPLGTVLWLYNKAMKKLKMEVGENHDE
jgi:RNA polymerase sigma-70 factor (ECF subfamily)